MDTNIKGDRGEAIVRLALTEYKSFPDPLFRPRLLGEKWPSLDFYVEVCEETCPRAFFFVQVKNETQPDDSRCSCSVSLDADDVRRLTAFPAPTYLVGVDDKKRTGYICSIQEPRSMGVSRIPYEFELTEANLLKLKEEVLMFWRAQNKVAMHSSFTLKTDKGGKS